MPMVSSGRPVLCRAESRKTVQASVRSGTTSSATAAKASSGRLLSVTTTDAASSRSRCRVRQRSSTSEVAPIHSTSSPSRTTGTTRAVMCRYSPEANFSR